MTMNSAYYELRESLRNEIDNLIKRRGDADKIIVLNGSKELDLFQTACINHCGVEYLESVPYENGIYIFVKIYKGNYYEVC